MFNKRQAGKSNSCGKGLLIMLAAAAMVSLVSVEAAAQRRVPIVRPAELNNKEQIIRFMVSVINQKVERPDPFVEGVRTQASEDQFENVESKPRPAYGFGKYDVDQLILQAIWKEKDKMVAVFKAPDNTMHTTKLGDEAYDGRIVEINFESRYVKFLNKITKRRTGGPGKKGELVETFVEKNVSIRR